MDNNKQELTLGDSILGLVVALFALAAEVLLMCFLWCLICWGIGYGFTWPGGVALWAAAKALNVAIRGLST